MRAEDRPRSNRYLGTDHTVGADLHIVRNPGRGIDDRRCVSAQLTHLALLVTIAVSAHQLGFRDHATTDQRACLELAHTAQDAGHLDFEPQLVAGRNRPLETRAIDAGEVKQRAVALCSFSVLYVRSAAACAKASMIKRLASRECRESARRNTAR